MRGGVAAERLPVATDLRQHPPHLRKYRACTACPLQKCRGRGHCRGVVLRPKHRKPWVHNSWRVHGRFLAAGSGYPAGCLRDIGCRATVLSFSHSGQPGAETASGRAVAPCCSTADSGINGFHRWHPTLYPRADGQFRSDRLSRPVYQPYNTVASLVV